MSKRLTLQYTPKTRYSVYEYTSDNFKNQSTLFDFLNILHTVNTYGRISLIIKAIKSVTLLTSDSLTCLDILPPNNPNFSSVYRLPGKDESGD